MMFEHFREMRREMHKEHGQGECRHRHGRGWWDDHRRVSAGKGLGEGPRAVL